MSPLLLVIAGPTGSGKSDLALCLAKSFDGEIVNCDSLQLYRFLNIGTAKTPVGERQGIPHHLFDILNPDELFTAGDYSRVARPLLRDIASRGKLPIVCGGTGFYLRALLHGLFAGPIRSDELRERLTLWTPERRHRLLRRLDPSSAGRIHPNDTQKLIRALEVCLIARRSLTDLHAGPTEAPLQGFTILKLGLNPDRVQLVRKIDDRCRRMFASGLLNEVRSLLTEGYPPSSKALEAIGYREALLHLDGQISYEAAIERTQIATRQYSKRQRTWFRKEPGIVWLDGFGSDKNVSTLATDKIIFLRNKKALGP